MANKREFKKFVDAVGNGVCEDILICSLTCDGIDQSAANKCIEKILNAVDTARDCANVHFDKRTRDFDDTKDYLRAKREFFRNLYKKINADLSKSLDEAVKEFNAITPEEVKLKNKAALAD